MGGVQKPFLELAGSPVLLHSLRPFVEHPEVLAIVVALSPEDAKAPPGWLRGLAPRVRAVAGGATRAESVFAALEALPREVEVVLVHDAARPLVTPELVTRCIRGVGKEIGAVLGVPASDTLQEVDEEGWVTSTPKRGSLWHAQTPQGFPMGGLLDAYTRAGAGRGAATDDAALFVRSGGRVRMVEGARWNLKVTVPEDLEIAAHLLAGRDRAGGEG
jgi:2-C-methyl-D-erythritol 4-phosphate cytidylyltransferase